MIRPTHRRRGITLLEVLAAIFIMGIGLLSLLTLFPLGALSMARGVRDDRAAAIAAASAGMAQTMNLGTDPNLLPFLGPQYQPQPPNQFMPANPNGPGYPVLVDPFYFLLGSNTFGTQPGTPGLARVAPTYASNKSTAAQWFSFLDEITFDTSGVPVGSTGSPPSVDRPTTYTWSYLLRRPRSSDPSLVELSVIVYANRSPDAVEGETTPAVVPSVVPTTGVPSNVAGSNTISLNYAQSPSYPSGTKPNIRKGTWIMDVSYVTGPGGQGTINGYCYKVATVADTGATTLDVVVEPALAANVANIVVMENVIAVVPRSVYPWAP